MGIAKGGESLLILRSHGRRKWQASGEAALESKQRAKRLEQALRCH
ncbi:hypothetical protein [Adhaeretor mobilis]|nr:hypothetical protein [Adhaeretor mobilis]